jgi:hypothetical protein
MLWLTIFFKSIELENKFMVPLDPEEATPPIAVYLIKFLRFII